MKVNRTDFLELSQEILRRGVLLRFQAQGDSMQPFIENGDILIIEPADGMQAHVGDVVFCLRPDGRLFAHRLVRIDTVWGRTVLTTKGDSFDYFDPPLDPEQVLGMVVAIERDNRLLKLDSGSMRLAGRFWASWWPVRRYLHPVLRLGWRLYQRLTAR